MFYLLLLRYTASTAVIEPQIPAHVGYLERHHDDGTFVVSGQTASDGVGGVILAVGSRDRIAQIAAEDPLVVAGVATYEIVSIDAARYHDTLAELLSDAEADDNSWDDAALTRLRGGDVEVLRERRSLSSVLQHAGQALLEAGGVGTEDLARRCIAGLHERDWAGDDTLAMELRAVLGEPVAGDEMHRVPWPLTPTPVWLRDLAGCLDGDPLQGDGAVDLRTGDVYHPGSLEWERPEEMDEDSELFTPDRWLFFRPESGAGYRDMRDFAGSLPEGHLQDRLYRALEGRGAFRRFRDVLDDAPEPHLKRWYLFRDERELGRARQWLASNGCRSDRPTSQR